MTTGSNDVVLIYDAPDGSDAVANGHGGGGERLVVEDRDCPCLDIE